MKLLILCTTYAVLAALVWTRFRRNQMRDRVDAGLALKPEPMPIMWHVGVFMWRFGFCLLVVVFCIKTFWPGFNFLVWDQQDLLQSLFNNSTKKVCDMSWQTVMKTC